MYQQPMLHSLIMQVFTKTLGMMKWLQNFNLVEEKMFFASHKQRFWIEIDTNFVLLSCNFEIKPKIL